MYSCALKINLLKKNCCVILNLFFAIFFIVVIIEKSCKTRSIVVFFDAGVERILLNVLLNLKLNRIGDKKTKRERKKNKSEIIDNSWLQ